MLREQAMLMRSFTSHSSRLKSLKSGAIVQYKGCCGGSGIEKIANWNISFMALRAFIPTYIFPWFECSGFLLKFSFCFWNSASLWCNRLLIY